MADRTKNIVIPERLQHGGLSTHAYWPDYTKKYIRAQCPSATATIITIEVVVENGTGGEIEQVVTTYRDFLILLLQKPCRKSKNLP